MIEFCNIEKIYYTGEVKVAALREINFSIEDGEFVIIQGASGAGKSTILNLLGGMDRATSGEIKVNGNCITAYDDKKLTEYRGITVGFVFQFYNLIPNLTAFENVNFASEFTDNPLDSKIALSLVGMSDRANHFPSQLSGGEQQRVSIARAVAKNPELLLCDEPTGALDYETGKNILRQLQIINQEQKTTIVLITHNSMIAPIADKVIKVKSGRIENIITNDVKQSVEEIEW